MVDLARITGFDWDAGNRGKNLRHSVSDAEAEQVFFSVPLLILVDGSHSETEPRFHALGQTVASRRLHVTFALRGDGTLIRVISARDMHRKERAAYESKAQESP
ncbi:MAG: BrnT family toxin [Steroidobacteraceae bacterium]